MSIFELLFFFFSVCGLDTINYYIKKKAQCFRPRYPRGLLTSPPTPRISHLKGKKKGEPFL